MVIGAHVIRIKGKDNDEILEIKNLMQSAIDVTEPADLKKLLQKVKTSPGIVKTALKWI